MVSKFGDPLLIDAAIETSSSSQVPEADKLLNVNVIKLSSRSCRSLRIL